MSIWHPEIQPEWVSVFLYLSLSLSIFHSFAFRCFWVKTSLDWRTVPRSRLYVTLILEIWSSDLFVMEISEISADVLTQFWGEWVLTTRRAAIKHLCHQKWCNLREQGSWQWFASRWWNMEVDSVMHPIKKQLLSQESLHGIKMNFRRWNGTASTDKMAGQKSAAGEDAAVTGRKTSSKGNVYGRARLRIGGFQATQSEGHGRAKVPGDGCHGQVQVEFLYIYSSTSCTRDPVACMLEPQEVRPGLVLPTWFQHVFFELTRISP